MLIGTLAMQWIFFADGWRLSTDGPWKIDTLCDGHLMLNHPYTMVLHWIFSHLIENKLLGLFWWHFLPCGTAPFQF